MGVMATVLFVVLGLGSASTDPNRAPDPNRANEAFESGNRYLQSGYPDNALLEFNRGLAIVPDSIPGLLGRAATYQALGDVERAIADYTAVLEIDPNNADALRELSLARGSSGQ